MNGGKCQGGKGEREEEMGLYFYPPSFGWFLQLN